ncbi:DUF4912 domain-containing protein [Alkalispirochaeta alkalica]|uniref:DUF4912 domain-containing protein n=1 Tax=Alkalispirochaeta alkalica TaxID=46356 RepID=UPI0003660BD7|nr:DUF4912 domain-containing protein [Alkalispirochaeta alkalica]
MIRRRLEELSLQALFALAEQNGLDLGPDTDRGSVIEELEDLIAENQEDREQNNSVTVRIQQKKFTLINDDDTPLTGEQLDGFELPDDYEINKITLMLRDPRWAFAYWDLSSAKKREYSESSRFDGISLRVIEVEREKQEIVIRDSFEIPVQLSDSSWYIHIPRQKTSYRIQLIGLIQHRRELLAVSNRIYVPAAHLPVTPEAMTPRQMALFELCGMEYLEVSPFGSDAAQSTQE